MAEFPALPLFTDALLADTAHLNDEEFGAYVRLMILEWRTPGCRMPAEKSWLMRRLKVNDKEFSTLYKSLIDEFFKKDGNYIFQKRLQKEFNYLREQSQKQSARSKSRWNKEKDSCRGSTASGYAPHPTPPHLLNKNNSSSFSVDSGKGKKDLNLDKNELNEKINGKKFDFADACEFLEKHFKRKMKKEEQELLATWMDTMDFVSEIVPIIDSVNAYYAKKHKGLPYSLKYYQRKMQQ